MTPSADPLAFIRANTRLRPVPHAMPGARPRPLASRSARTPGTEKASQPMP